MKRSNTTIITHLFLVAFLLFSIVSCQEEEMVFPITNDFRVLQVKFSEDRLSSGEDEVPVIGELELIFSHAVNPSALESALSISPNVDYTISYDGTGSFATVTFSQPLDYDGMYTISLPQGTYGANGESSTEDFTFTFSTQGFEAPAVSLTASALSLFEGETISLTVAIANPILRDISMDLVFAGSAVGAGVDYEVSAGSITIPAGSTSASVELMALTDAELEGEETIIITIENLENAVENSAQQLNLTLGDTPPALEFKGVMSLKIGGSRTNGRAIHLRVLEDIADLSIYGVGIANNGGGSDGREIDFPALSVLAGEDILLVRDDDLGNLSGYFGDCFNDFDHVVESGSVNFNGDDPFELYKDSIAIETYGDVELDGTGLEWEWTGSWAYKLNGQWEYAEVDCSENATSNSTASCPYPFCTPLQLQGVLALLWDGSGTNGGKAVHLRANRDIDDLSQYSLGVANNGGGSDGIEFTFSATSVREGDHILVAREPETLASYFGTCFSQFDLVVQSGSMNQNGDDAIELFLGMELIETYGDANVDGTGEVWEYAGSWGYKQASKWRYGGVDCGVGSGSTQSSACPYLFCN